MCFLWKPNIEKMIEKGDVDGLIKLLKKNGKNNIEAVTALGELGDPQAIASISSYMSYCIEHRYINPVEVCVRALAKINDLRAAEPLLNALSFGFFELAGSALVRISEQDQDTAVLITKKIRSRFAHFQWGHAMSQHERKAGKALIAVSGQIGTSEAIVMLLEYMGRAKNANDRISYPFEREARSALDMILMGNETNLICEAAQEVEKFDWQGKKAAVEYLQEVKGKRAASRLQRILDKMK